MAAEVSEQAEHAEQPQRQSQDRKEVFRKDNLDYYLKELAKEYRKLGGKKMPAEIILIGGASVLINYGFRDMTTDVDAVIHAASSMKDAINHVGDRCGLPNGWLNADFMQTDSYTPRIDQYSVYYRTYANCVTFRTVPSEYLIAMKLRSGRRYKKDRSDIVGILADHESRGVTITREQIETAVCNLYGDMDQLSEEIRRFLDHVMENGNYAELYAHIAEEEKEARSDLILFEKAYPGVLHGEIVGDVLDEMRSRVEIRAKILSRLKRKEEKNENQGSGE